jgi:peptidyl-prolyl cis-trans isomerase D
MISWMQHNKKWLIVTLWISTIAFIGAGFVGWGSYQYGSKGRSIAKIGEVDITMSELQITYNNLYGYYSQMFGGNFDESMAKEMRLQESAFSILKREALLLNLAKDYGLKALDEEIAENIFKNESFQKDGNFDRSQYELILKNSRLTPKEYEERLAKVITISKLQEILFVKATPFEEEVINSLTRLQDKLELKILTVGDVEVSVSEDEIRNFWEMSKGNYLTEKEYRISYIESPLLEDANYSENELHEFYNTNALEYSDNFENSKELVKNNLIQKDSKKEAMRDYLSFKKGEYSGEIISTKIGEVNLILSSEDMEDLRTASVGDVLKPKFSNGSFISVKLDEVVEPVIDSFENVKYMVENELLSQKRTEALLELAKNSYNSFSGEETEYLRITDGDKIPLLYPQEGGELLQTIFTQSTDNGFAKIGSKIVLYRVLEQKIGDKSDTGDNSDLIINIKERLLDENLIKKLEYYYPIETYLKG